MRSGLADILGRLILLVVVAGCGSNLSTSAIPTSPPGQDFSLLLINVDGPPVDVLVNGTLVLHAACDPKGERTPPALTATTPFPWDIEVRRTNGASLGSFVENGREGPETILVRTDGATLIPRGANPGPAPAPTCAP